MTAGRAGIVLPADTIKMLGLPVITIISTAARCLASSSGDAPSRDGGNSLDLSPDSITQALDIVIELTRMYLIHMYIRTM